MRLTKHRQEIITLLENTDGTMSAALINAALPHINLVTIYRSLEYFVKEGIVKKLHLGEQEAQYEAQQEPHHHAICNKCNRVIHFTLDDEKLKTELALPNFIINELEITLRGTCSRKHKK